jgi:hypothetical protein
MNIARDVGASGEPVCAERAVRIPSRLAQSQDVRRDEDFGLKR